MAQPYVPGLSGRGRWSVPLLLSAASLVLDSGCGLDHYEQQMDSEQKRLKYLDDENQNLEGSPLRLPEKKADDKEAVPDRDFFFRPPKGISTTPDAKPVGIFYRYPSINPNAGIQELLVAVKKESTDKFRKDVLQNLPGLGLSVAGPAKPRDVGVPAGHPVHYDFYELQSGPNQPTSYVYFYREVVPGEGTYQVALVFRALASSQAGIANDSPVMELTLASLRVDRAARIKYGRFRPAPQAGPGNKR